MAGGIGPPQDSTRRALVRTSPKESARTRPCEEPQRFVRQNQKGELGAASRVQRLGRPRLCSRLAEAVVSLDKGRSPFPSPSMLGRSSSPSRVRYAAHTPRALDCCGRPAPPHRLRGKGALGSVASGAARHSALPRPAWSEPFHCGGHLGVKAKRALDKADAIIDGVRQRSCRLFPVGPTGCHAVAQGGSCATALQGAD